MACQSFVVITNIMNFTQVMTTTGYVFDAIGGVHLNENPSNGIASSRSGSRGSGSASSSSSARDLALHLFFYDEALVGYFNCEKSNCEYAYSMPSLQDENWAAPSLRWVHAPKLLL